MSHHHRRAAAVSAPDPFFSNTVLLLSGNGTNGGQNNTFVDSSTNNFTVTRFGNTTQGSFSPFSAPDGRWSNYFDANGKYLSAGSSTSLALGSGSYTVECWVYLTAYNSSTSILLDWRTNGGISTNIPAVSISGTGQVSWYESVPTLAITSSSVIALNVWTHFAIVRSGTTVTMYLNGSSVGATTSSANLGIQTLRINDVQGSYVTFGYISNVRILKGTAQYSGSSFAVPTSPLTAITNTSLLTCQSNRFKDNSSNAFAITPSGNAAVTSFSPFAPLAEYSAGSNGGSGYFDGSGDYLTFTGITLSGDFCCECWYYRTANSTNYSTVFGGSSSAANANNHQFIITNTGGITLVLSATAVINSAGTAFVNNAWNHVAWVRNGTNCAVFVNGVRQGTGTSSISTSVCSRIADIAGISGYQVFGYISNARIVSGSSVYDPTATTFTPPTAPLTAITNTSLLFNFTNASILDSTSKNNLETVGNAQISTSVKKFGTGSLAFDGTGDYLILPASSDFAFGTDNFTIEFWLYMNATSGDKNIYDPRTTGSQVVPVLYAQSGAIIYFVSNANRIVGSTLSASTWYHIAVSRSGTSTKLFVNGTQSGSAYTDSNNYIAGRLALGAYAPNTINALNGYMDDLRVTKGIARYTANFTPPYRQLPTR